MTGQLIGGTIENVLTIMLGIWALWVWPRHLQRRVENGKISNDEAQAKLKKFSPKWGYAFIIVGIGRMLFDLLR